MDIKNTENCKASRRASVISLLIITPLGFASKFYIGPFQDWLNNSFTGILYEIFWCLIIVFFFPRAVSVMIASLVLIITCILEFLQLWHSPFLEAIRMSFIGSVLIGTTFVWSDFLYYFVRSAIGYKWIVMIRKHR